MANKKIAQLPVATTPVASTDVLLVVKLSKTYWPVDQGILGFKQ